MTTNTCAACGRIYDPVKPHDCADRTAFTHGLEHLDGPSDAVLAALTPRPADEVLIGGKRWRVVPSGFGYDDGSQSARLIEVAERCRHAVYNHGCPSCDARDVELVDRLEALLNEPRRKDDYDPDVCAICDDVECDGIACVAALDSNDPEDHPMIEQIQDWVRLGRVT